MNFPSDIKAEIILNYLQDQHAIVELHGMHKRNTYEDILCITDTSDGIKCEIARDGIYDILPEALFHPIDRFENLPANEYKERFDEEYEQQQAEEANARNFFALFDRYLINLNQTIEKLKEPGRYDDSVISQVILDKSSNRYTSNRFINRLKPYIPLCRKIRGDRTLITLIIRRILFEEGIELELSDIESAFYDKEPRYNYSIQDPNDDCADLYLGSYFDESVSVYIVKYWNEDECNAEFLSFIDEMKIFEEFINDYFIGIGSSLKFCIATHTLPVRLSDELCHNFLEYNTNL